MVKTPKNAHPLAMFKFGYPDGTDARFQTTQSRCGGDLEEAKRLCRICYTYFEQGWTREEQLSS